MTICSVVPDFIVYTGTDNVFSVFLRKNNKAIEDLSFITKVVIACGSESVDSSITPGVIWWTDSGEYFDQTANVLSFKLGSVGLTEGLKTGCRITVYDAININGIVYADNLKIENVAPES